jgi:hypothetical protein
MVENETHQKLACLRTDRGGEFLSMDFNSYCKTIGIRRQLTTVGTPQQNGVAKRKNRHLCETMRSLLFSANMPTCLWEEVDQTANYVSNWVPHRALYRISPLQAFIGQLPDISHLRIFGCVSYIHIQKRHKLEPKSRALTLVGYDELTKAYRCLDYKNKRILISRDVSFDESSIGIPDQHEPSSSLDKILQSFIDQNSQTQVFPSSSNLLSRVTSPNHTQSPRSSNPSSPPVFPSSEPFLFNSPLHTTEPFHVTNPSPIVPRQSRRTRKINVRLDDYILSITPDDYDVCMSQALPDLDGDNMSLEQELHDPKWKEAMSEEYRSIIENSTWDLVPLPFGKCPIRARWVLKTKPSLQGQSPRLKARLIARGFQQRHGIDFDEVFVPVVKWSTIRTLTACIAQLNHSIHHLDVKTAFLYGHLQEEVYMDQLVGFEIHGKQKLICKLN